MYIHVYIHNIYKCVGLCLGVVYLMVKLVCRGISEVN